MDKFLKEINLKVFEDWKANNSKESEIMQNIKEECCKLKEELLRKLKGTRMNDSRLEEILSEKIQQRLLK